MKATKRIILILSVLALLIGCFAFTSSAAEDQVTLDFTKSVTNKSTQAYASAALTTAVKGAAGDDSNLISSVSGTNLYPGNSSGGYKQDTGCIKAGKSGGNGSLEITFSKKVIKVEIQAVGWAANKNSNMSVNGSATQTTKNTSDWGTYFTYEIAPSEKVTISFTERSLVRTIIVTFEPSFVCDCSETTLVSNNNGTHNEVCAEPQCGKVVKSNIACDIAYTDNGNGTHTEACQDGCGYSKTVNCTEGAYAPNGDGETHSAKCGVCNAVLDANVLCTDNGNGVCEECEGAITVKHVFEYESNGDRTHSVSCSHCDDSFDSEACADEDKDTFCDYCGAFVAYVASFVTPDGITAPANVNGYTVTLPTLDNGANYSFAGWATEKVRKTETKPTLYNGNVTLTADVTYYAVFSYDYKANVTVKTEGSWNLVKDVANLKVGDQIIIVASASNVALSTTQNGNNRGQVAITKNTDGTVTINNSVQIITLEVGTTTGTFAFNTGAGYLYAASSGSNYLRTQENKDANASWSISIDSAGKATVKAAGSNTKNWLRYNSSSSIFSCYGSGQQDICIYKYTEGEERVEPKDFTNYSSTIARFSGANVNLGANLSVKYAVDTIYNLDDLKVVFTFGGEKLEPVSVEEGRFILKNIAPNQMGVSIKAELMLGDDVIATHDGYSVLESLENVKDTDEETKELVEATLAYGDAASAYRNGDALTEDDRLEWVDNGNDVLEIEDENAYFKSFSVYFAEVNKIRVKYNALPEGYKVYLEGTEIVGENGVIETDGILANQLGSTYVFVIEDADGNVVATLECNVFAYCAMAKDSKNIAMANLATTLNNYGALAANY